MSLEAKLKRNKEVCDQVVRKYLPKSKYEITEIYAPEFVEPFRCNISFKRVGYEAQVDCEGECGVEFPDDSELTGSDEWKENYDSCVEECEDTRRTSIVGAVSVDPDTLGVTEATIPASCRHIWFSWDEFEDMEKQEKEFSREQFRMIKAFEKVGCEVEVNTLHPHHFGPLSEPDEHGDPAVCYVHPIPKLKGKCKLPDLLKVVEEWV